MFHIGHSMIIHVNCIKSAQCKMFKMTITNLNDK